MDTRNAEIIIVGAAIIGLAHAYIAPKSGKKVVVFERTPASFGASIVNLGRLWPIAQTARKMFDLAVHSRHSWLEVLDALTLCFGVAEQTFDLLSMRGDA